VTGRSIQARIAEISASLPASQRRVADLVVEDPEAVAFGTVGSVADRSATSNPTVIRFAASLGFDGFTELRDAVRAEVSQRLRTAAGRVRRPSRDRLLAAALETERANIDKTFAALDDEKVAQATDLLADETRRLWILPNSQMHGIGSHLADDLALCRRRVVLLDGSEFRIFTMLASLQRGDTLVSLDTQRHEAWFVRVQRGAVQRGARPLALTDRLPCSLDLSGGLALTFACDTVNPFESRVGLVALCNVLVTSVVERLRKSVASRVDRMEDTWVRNDLFD